MIIIYYLTQTFREVALSLLESLRESGFPCQIAPDLEPDVVNDRENLYILMGLNNPFPYLPPQYIAYQFEQAGSHWFTKNYIRRLRGAVMVWDYSLTNLQYLRNHCKLKNTYYVPVGYSPCLAITDTVELTDTVDSTNGIEATNTNGIEATNTNGIEATNTNGIEATNTNANTYAKTIDILFYGSLNARRQAILNYLRSHQPNWRIEVKTDLWEAERNSLIDSSRIVLNLHYYSEAILETTRLSLLMSRGACVVSEKSRDSLLDRVYKPYLKFIEAIDEDYSELVQVCQDLLKCPEIHAQICAKTQEYRRLHTMLNSLPIEALNKAIKLETPETPETPETHLPERQDTPNPHDKPNLHDSHAEVLDKKFDSRVPFQMVELNNQSDGTSILKLTPPTEADYVPISLVTPTRNRSVFLPLMLKNLQSFKYPKELIEWVIIDDSDSEEADKMRSTLPLSDPRIKYIHCDRRMPVWEKRNLAVENASHEIIIHMDDDDYYLPESIYAKVKLLRKYQSQGYACLGSREIGIYHLIDNYSFIMKSQLMGEAGVAYFKQFWRDRPYKDRELKFGEGAYFLQGRTDQVLDLPYWFNLIALSHGNNYTQNLRKLSPKDQAKIEQNFFNLWEIETQLFFISLRKKLVKSYN